jgi:hypothetical protein
MLSSIKEGSILVSAKIQAWKANIADRKAKGQSVKEWCLEHNTTAGSYHYWRKKIKEVDVSVKTSLPMESSVVFAQLPTPTTQSVEGVHIHWRDVSIQFKHQQEAVLAAQFVAQLQRLC